MLRTTVATALLFCAGAFAQQNPPTNSQITAPSQRTPSSADNQRTLSTPTDKAAAYDKWTDDRKMSVSKGMGHDMSTMSTSERTAAWAKMTQDEKAAAYDYYIAHPDTTTTKQTN